jgi:hypothetical protein
MPTISRFQLHRIGIYYFPDKILVEHKYVENLQTSPYPLLSRRGNASHTFGALYVFVKGQPYALRLVLSSVNFRNLFALCKAPLYMDFSGSLGTDNCQTVVPISLLFSGEGL